MFGVDSGTGGLWVTTTLCVDGIIGLWASVETYLNLFLSAINGLKYDDIPDKDLSNSQG